MAKLAINKHKTRADAEISYLQKVDDICEALRMKLMTPGTGQSMVYDIKYQEALMGFGPYIEAEAEALEVPLQTVIDSVIAARQSVDQKVCLLEGKRIKTKRLIREASSAAEMHSIIASANLSFDID